MSNFLKCAILIIVFLNTASYAGGIKNQMHPEALKKSGLEKLSEQELKYLDDWLKDNCSSKGENGADAKVLSRTILGEFSGWSGKTVFKMENGETWRQRIGGKYYKELNSPKVVITKNAFNLYVMEVVETGRKVGVKKIK